MHGNVALAVAFVCGWAVSASAQQPPEWTQRVAPVRIVDNIYYVGSADLASFLVTTPAGHMLIDTGHQQNAGMVAESIAALGFKLTDVRFILTTQAHFDHVGAHARLKALSGARVVVSAADAPIVEAGGKGDYFFSGATFRFPAVKVDRTVRDGETLTLGGVTLTAHLTPGHTRGCTTWTMTAHGENGAPLDVVFAGSTTVVEGVRLVKNAAYPTIADDYQRSFAVLESLPCDVFLAAHLSLFGGLDKLEKAHAGARPNPFIDPAGYREAVARSHRAFLAALRKQQPQ